MAVARNLAKAWLLLVGFCVALAALGWALGDYRLASIFLFCGLPTAGGLAFYADRVVLGMVGAHELPLPAAPIVHSTVQRLSLIAGAPQPRVYVRANADPRGLSGGLRRGPGGRGLWGFAAGRRRRAARARADGGAVRFPVEPREGAAVPGHPVPRRRPCRTVGDAPAGRRARAAASLARPGVEGKT